jgi:hypothetical protein
MAHKPVQKEAADNSSRRGVSSMPDEPGWAVAVERRGFWVAAAGLALLLVLFFNPIFFAGKEFQPPDVVASLAQRTYVQEAFHSEGSVLQRYPLWTPYLFSGMPSFGSLIAAPYTNPMSLLLTPIPGLFKVVTYYFLLGLFTWLLLRRLGLRALSALFGAVAFVFCAHVITLIMFGHNSKIATLIFLPLVLLATHELWQRITLRWTAILALAIGTMLVSSHLQISYYTFLTAGLYLVVATIESLRRGMKLPAVLARWVVWASAFAVGLAASAVLFLSVREYSAHSIRGGTGGGLPFDYATNWSFHPLEITTFFVSSFMGFGQSTYWGWMPFTDFPHYMGILVIVLAALTIALWHRERMTLLLIALGAIALVLSFGKHVPLLYSLFFDYFPQFNKFRVPSMMLVLFQFAMAGLAAIGLDRLARAPAGPERERMFRALRFIGAATLVVIVVLGIFTVSGGLKSAAAKRLGERGPEMGLSPEQVGPWVAGTAVEVVRMASRDALLTLLILVAGLALLWTRMRGRLSGGAMSAAVLVLLFVDLWRVGAKPADYHPKGARAQVFAATPAVQFLQAEKEPYRILPLTGQGTNKNWFAYFKISSIQGYHAAKLKIYQDLIDEQGPVGIVKQLSRGNFNVINMLNAKFLVADQEIQGGPLMTVVRDNQFVMRNTSALPRMWFVDRARVIADEASHLQAVADPSWRPDAEALLFKDVGPLDAGNGGTARVTRYEPREIHAEVESPGNSLLVISEVFYEPGWDAWLDGKPTEVLRADYVLRAIRVPPGKHELRMRFDPPSFRSGVFLSLGAYGLIVIALAASFVLDRRRAHHGSGPGSGTAA